MVFNETRNVLKKRGGELDIMISNLSNLKVGVEYSAIGKSSIVMMIYNMIEGVFSTLLQEVFDYAIQNCHNIEQYPKNFLIIIANYHIKLINGDAKKLLKFENKNITIPQYSEYKRHIEFYSGNLDAKKIREIANKFGVVKIIEKKSDAQLVFIKKIRNHLAHGSVSYEEATRDRTDVEVKEIKNATVDYLDRVIQAFETVYLNKLGDNQ